MAEFLLGLLLMAAAASYAWVFHVLAWKLRVGNLEDALKARTDELAKVEWALQEVRWWLEQTVENGESKQRDWAEAVLIDMEGVWPEWLEPWDGYRPGATKYPLGREGGEQ